MDFCFINRYEDAIKEVIKIRKKLNGQKVEQEYILQNLKKDCEHAEELRKQIEVGLQAS